MKIRYWIIAALVLGVAVIAYYYFGEQTTTTSNTLLKTTVRQGSFEVAVTASGELRAKRSEKIYGPQGMRTAGVFNTTITQIVPEGTRVKEGDYVATLDRTELSNKMQALQTDIEKSESQLLQARLDTAIEMRGLRDQLINQTFMIEEKELEVEQNIYEPPAVQRQTQIELERLQRDYEQSKENYTLKTAQAQARIQEIRATLTQHKNSMQRLNDLSDQFMVRAPKAGMVIYEREWGGKKGPGSRIMAWNPVVAQLPDLSDMTSLTYVNEVDVSKVKRDQEVRIRVDAFPEKAYTGRISSIANIGEQRPNFDAKVFEVSIQVMESDTTLRPSMTTSNEIVTNTFEDVLFIPLESLHSNDSLTYVYRYDKNRLVQQEVITGASNEQDIIIEHGLSVDEEVLLSIPPKSETLPLVRLSEEVRMAYQRKKEEEAEKRKQDALQKQQQMEAMRKQFSPAMIKRTN